MTTIRRGPHLDKTDLTPREKLKCAYFYEVRGVSQQILADLFEVNMGRVNEAIMLIRKALNSDDMNTDEVVNMVGKTDALT